MVKPKRVKIKGQWYDTGEGLDGSLEFRAYGSPIYYKAREPFVHISNFYHLYDSSGNKVGEFDIDNRTCSGYVTDVEI
jgi:hypothetical protein